MRQSLGHGSARPIILLCCTILVLGFCASLGAEPLRMVQGVNGVARYSKGVLHLIEKEIPDVHFEWDETTPSTTEARIIEMIDANKLDICWYATTNEFESRMLPIRIPLYRGLLGYRVLMIREGTQSKFDNIETLDDLKRISLGQGRFWADTDILVANGLNVVKVTQYNSLFYMLDGGRFDAFPRGVHEPWYEIPNWPDLSLTVEKHLMMQYTNPFYFFVNKNNTRLAGIIEKAFRKAIDDGSFQQYFLNDPTIKDVLLKANIDKRHVIRLKNPSLPPQTPVDEKKLWFDPFELKQAEKKEN